ALALFTMAIAAGAYPAIPGAIAALRRMRLEMSALVCIAIAGAIGLGEWMEAATVAFLYSISGLLDAWSHARRPHDHSLAAVLPSFVSYYTPVMISIATLTIVFTHSFYRALIVLMDSCPCALLIAAPVPLAAASVNAYSDEKRITRIINQNLAFTI